VKSFKQCREGFSDIKILIPWIRKRENSRV